MQLWKIDPSLRSSRHNHMDSGEGLRTSGLTWSYGLRRSPVFKAVVPARHPHLIPRGSDQHL